MKIKYFFMLIIPIIWFIIVIALLVTLVVCGENWINEMNEVYIRAFLLCAPMSTSCIVALRQDLKKKKNASNLHCHSDKED